MTFTNPYEVENQSFSGPDKNLCRAPASIGVDDYSFIRSIRPITGTVNTTQNILWFKLCVALKSAGIVDVSHQAEFEDFVANLQIKDNRKAKKSK